MHLGGSGGTGSKVFDVLLVDCDFQLDDLPLRGVWLSKSLNLGDFTSQLTPWIAGHDVSHV